jgi:hypothetical protein
MSSGSILHLSVAAMRYLGKLLTLVAVLLLASANSPICAEDPRAVDIRGEEGEVIIAADQIKSYDWATHTLTLAPGVHEQLEKSFRDSRIVSGRRFALTVAGASLYEGVFTSVLSSRSFDVPVILIDGARLRADLGPGQLPIQLGYPAAQFFKGKDPRSNPLLRVALKATGKFVQDAREHTNWILQSLVEMQTIKVGMTREDLLLVFVEEGGLSTRTERRYAYRDCPYIKVNVRFNPVGDSEDSTQSPQDTIASISQPFLEASIGD